MKKPLNNRVVIVGYEIATCLGFGLNKTWDRAVKGETGFTWITRVDVGDYDCQAVGEIPNFDLKQFEFLDSRELKNWFSKFIPFSMGLCHSAVKHAGIDMSRIDPYRIGLIIGSALNGLDGYERNVKALMNGDHYKISPYLLPNVCANLTCGKASILLGIKGPQFALESACATGNHCIAEAAKIIQRGDAAVMLAGGVEIPLLKPIIYGFGNMNALLKKKANDRAYDNAKAASRPYSIDRRGFVLSEGGAILVLSSLDFALNHDLRIYAEVLGTGMNGDACHYTAPDQQSVAKCIQLALDDAEMNIDEIGYINGHGTSTKVGDKTEIQALRQVFGSNIAGIPVSSNKSQIGHSLGATAAIEAVLSVHGMQKNIILPNANYLPDPDFAGVNLVGEKAIPFKYRHVLSNAFGFGGTNCCLVLRKWDHK